MASSGFVSIYSDEYPVVSVRPSENDADIVFESEVSQPLSGSESESGRVEYQSESEDVASSSAYETSSSRPETRDSVVVLTSSPRVNTADYPESVASMGSPSESISGYDRDSLPSYSAAVVGGYHMESEPGTFPCPPVDTSSRELREDPHSAEADLDFALDRFNLEEDAELDVESRSLAASSSQGTSTTSSTFSDSTCSSSECYVSDSDDSGDSDEDEGRSHSDSTDGDGNQNREDSNSDASQGSRYGFEDSVDGNTTEEYDSDDSSNESESDDLILLFTIANLDPEDLIPMSDGSGYSSSGSSYDNCYAYQSDVQKVAGLASGPPAPATTTTTKCLSFPQRFPVASTPR